MKTKIFYDPIILRDNCAECPNFNHRYATGGICTVTQIAMYDEDFDEHLQLPIPDSCPLPDYKKGDEKKLNNN